MRYCLFALFMSVIILSGCGQQATPAQTASGTVILSVASEPVVVASETPALPAVASESVASESTTGK